MNRERSRSPVRHLAPSLLEVAANELGYSSQYPQPAQPAPPPPPPAAQNWNAGDQSWQGGGGQNWNSTGQNWSPAQASGGQNWQGSSGSNWQGSNGQDWNAGGQNWNWSGPASSTNAPAQQNWGPPSGQLPLPPP